MVKLGITMGVVLFRFVRRGRYRKPGTGATARCSGDSRETRVRD
jgi:hypothetical protein